MHSEIKFLFEEPEAIYIFDTPAFVKHMLNPIWQAGDNNTCRHVNTVIDFHQIVINLLSTNQ